jgi:type I restriction enzyme S subunit
MMGNKMKIGDVMKISSGGTPSRKRTDFFENGNIPWIKTGDLKSKYVSEASEYITELGLNNSSASIFPAGTVLIAMYGATIGACSILTKAASTNQACAGLFPNEKVKSEYLYYYLLYSKRRLINMGVGGAQPHISQTILKRFQITLPPLPIQRRIAAILDQADALRRKDAELLARYDALAQSVFLELFTNLEGDPVPLSELCKVNPRKSEIKDYDRSILVSFVPMANVSEQGHLTLEEERTIDDVWSGYTYFKEDDVVFAKITPCMENGKGAIMRGLKNGLGFGTTEFHVLRPIPGKSNSEWLYYLTASNKFREIASVNMTGSAGQKRVPTTFFDKFKLVPPPIELQNEFASRVKLIEQQIALVKENLIKSEDLFQSLLQKAFKGELVSMEIKITEAMTKEGE